MSEGEGSGDEGGLPPGGGARRAPAVPPNGAKRALPPGVRDDDGPDVLLPLRSGVPRHSADHPVFGGAGPAAQPRFLSHNANAEGVGRATAVEAALQRSQVSFPSSTAAGGQQQAEGHVAGRGGSHAAECGSPTTHAEVSIRRPDEAKQVRACVAGGAWRVRASGARAWWGACAVGRVRGAWP